ncbi:MAG: hypothetical protein MJ252_08815 [archaeon]|nr:hypothetical protein [archaeon]
MLPLELLKGCKNKNVLVQIKNGDSINGTLEKIDIFMNLKINNVIYTNKDGTNFYNTKEIFIKGNNIAAINFEENLIEDINMEKELKLQEKTNQELNAANNQKNDKKFLNKKRTEFDSRGRGGHNFRGRGRGTKRGK